MAKQETVLTKKRRGPAPTGKGTLIGVRLQPLDLAALDAWRRQQEDLPSRPEGGCREGEPIFLRQRVPVQ